MSSVDARLACLASPARARSLFTVRAAISSAVSSLRPWSSRPSLMCSYCRSRFALQAFGMVPPSIGLENRYPSSRRILGRPHQQLAEVAPGEQPAEGLGGRLEP